MYIHSRNRTFIFYVLLCSPCSLAVLYAAAQVRRKPTLTLTLSLVGLLAPAEIFGGRDVRHPDRVKEGESRVVRKAQGIVVLRYLIGRVQGIEAGSPKGMRKARPQPESESAVRKAR